MEAAPLPLAGLQPFMQPFMHPFGMQMAHLPPHFMPYGAWQARRMVAMAHAMSTAMHVASVVQGPQGSPPLPVVPVAPPAPSAAPLTPPLVSCAPSGVATGESMVAALALLGMAVTE